MQYQQITRDDLSELGIVQGNSAMVSNLMDLYSLFFDINVIPYKALILFHHEYDDYSWANNIVCITFYDKNGNELVPLKEKSYDYRKYVLNCINASGVGLQYTTARPQKDIHVMLQLPDLYIKVNK